MHSTTRRSALFVVLAVMMTTSASACSAFQSDKVHLEMMPLERMPMDVQTAPSEVQLAYQFAAANPDLVTKIPCYCGCVSIGHTSNYDCYVSNVDQQGNVTFDSHAVNCSVCVNITQDVMRLMRDGHSIQTARADVDATYSKSGPSNLP